MLYPEQIHSQEKYKNYPNIAALLNVADRVGVRILVGTRNRRNGKIPVEIIFKDGKKHRFETNPHSSNDFGLNSVDAVVLANDKLRSTIRMKEKGYPVVVGRTFTLVRDALAYAKEIGFPLFVKPNSGNQGRGVELVHTESELEAAAKRIISKMRNAVLIEKPIKGRDYRINVLDGKTILAYERIPLEVVGDGVSSIGTLLELKQKMLLDAGHGTIALANDPRIGRKLERDYQGMTLDSVPRAGAHISLLDNANISSGGEAVNVTEHISAELKTMCDQLSKDMDLRLSGIDILVDGDISDPRAKCVILEINGNPGLTISTTVEEYWRELEEMCVKVLQALKTKLGT